MILLASLRKEIVKEIHSKSAKESIWNLNSAIIYLMQFWLFLFQQ